MTSSMRNFRRRVGGSPFRRLQPSLSDPGPVRPGRARSPFSRGRVRPWRRVCGVSGLQDQGFGRIQLRFDTEVEITARAANGVLVIKISTRAFRSRASVWRERCPLMSRWCAIDPDGTGMRLALTQNFSANVLEAGEIAFVDLLPERWTGMAPGLPQEVIADLARRAREAERRFEEDLERRQTEVPRDIARADCGIADPHPPDLRSTGLRAPASSVWRTTSSNCGSANPSGWRRNVRWPIFPACSRSEDEQARRRVDRCGCNYRGPVTEARGFHEESSYIVDIEPFNFDVPGTGISLRGDPDSRPATRWHRR